MLKKNNFFKLFNLLTKSYRSVCDTADKIHVGFLNSSCIASLYETNNKYKQANYWQIIVMFENKIFAWIEINEVIKDALASVSQPDR